MLNNYRLNTSAARLLRHTWRAYRTLNCEGKAETGAIDPSFSRIFSLLLCNEMQSTRSLSDFKSAFFLQELSKHNARAVVRVCEPTYETKPLLSNGIDVLDWEFVDGSPPPPEVCFAFFLFTVYLKLISENGTHLILTAHENARIGLPSQQLE